MARDGCWCLVIIGVGLYAGVLVVFVQFSKWESVREMLEVVKGFCCWIEAPPIFGESVTEVSDVPGVGDVFGPGILVVCWRVY